MADAAYKNPIRKFPTYTTAQLKEAVVQYEIGEHPLQAYLETEHLAALKTEIANRENGTSKVFRVPQIM